MSSSSDQRDGRVRASVSNTGNATANQGYANSGVHVQIGDVNLRTGTAVRTRYGQQVQRISPPTLTGRVQELAELADFCTSPETSGMYQWWKADAWSGKSALLSWFVLHPPPNVRIVSFFVTARYASQNNRTAFIDNTVEQLLAFLGEELPPFLTESTREAHLLGLLNDVSEACRQRGEEFVLLVDGLDEDRSVTVGSDAYSVAALLPADPPMGMRVIVASRPNPPIPADVPLHHPLRNPNIVRPLTPSPDARAMRVDMERELKSLLQGSQTEQDLLGLLTAAGGGLTARDLSELTGLSTWQIDDHLATVTGRTFSRRNSHYNPGTTPDVYLLGHEELWATAHNVLGTRRLTEYRQTIHTWAERYQLQGWPSNTPEYLIRGYNDMLVASEDLTRILVCATDPARQDRLLEVSGGDAAALGEINVALRLFLKLEDADLAALVRLAVHRDNLIDRNTGMPVEAPAIWVALGNLRRAEALIESFSDADRRCQGYILAAREMFFRGHKDRAKDALGKAEVEANAITSVHQQDRALASLVDVLVATAGQKQYAEGLIHVITSDEQKAIALRPLLKVMIREGAIDAAESLAKATITEPEFTAQVHLTIAQALVEVGKPDSAGRLIDDTEALTDRIANTYRRCQLLVLLAKSLAEVGQAGRADALLRRVDLDANRTANSYQKVDVLQSLANVLLELGHEARANEVIAKIEFEIGETTDTYIRADMLRWLAQLALKAKHVQRAEAIAMSIEDVDERIRLLSLLCRDLAQSDNGEIAAQLLDRIHAMVASRPEHTRRSWVFTPVIDAMIELDQLDRAESTINDSVFETHTQSQMLTSLSNALVRAGQLARADELLSRAENITRSMKNGYQHVHALASIANVLLKTGRTIQAEELIALARNLAVNKEDVRYGFAWRDIVETMVDTGDLVAAESMARSITSRVDQSWALVSVAEALVAVGDAERAVELLEYTEGLINPVADSADGVYVLTEIASVLVDLNQVAKALHLIDAAHEASDSLLYTTSEYLWSLSAVAHAMIRAGQIEHACAIGDSLDGAERSYVRKLVVASLADLGHATRAVELINAAESDARSIEDEKPRGWALVSVIESMTYVQLFDRAESLARSIDNPEQMCLGLLPIAKALLEDGQLESAMKICGDAEVIANSTAEFDKRLRSLGQIAEFLAEAGEFDQAYKVARSLADRGRLCTVLMHIAERADVPRATKSIAEALTLSRWTDSLGILSKLNPGLLTKIVAELSIAVQRDTRSVIGLAISQRPSAE